MEFKKNDKIIWDSHFGYEIGYFIGEGVMYNTFEVDLITGVVHGSVSHSKSEIHPYSEELVEKLTNKYGYEKTFSKTF
jgi:hypothetical protein